MTSTSYIWNHRVHERWGESRLCIWRLKFNPTFSESAIVDAIEAALTDAGVTSFAIYELLGYYDILLRLWLPNAVSLPRLEERLGEALFELDYEDSEYFEVSRIVRHWVWALPVDGRTGAGAGPHLREPVATTLLARPEQSMLERVNGLVDGSIPLESMSSGERELVRSWIGDGILAEFHPRDGFRYFVIIKRPSAAGSRQARRNLIDAIAAACDSIALRYGDEISLYEGSVEYLITGRFGPENFHQGMQDLLRLLNESGLSKLFLSRTFTAMALQPTFLHFVDRLETKERQTSPWPEFEDLLLIGETDEVEFKSSVFADVSRWLRSDPPTVVATSGGHTGAVARAVCGMLNKRLYGTVAIGIGEHSRLTAKMPADLSARAERLLEPYGRDRDLVLFGIGLDLSARDHRHWDEYVVDVQQYFSSQIVPDPSPFLRFVRHERNGTVFLLVRTSPPTEVDWFYVKEDGNLRFFVRFNAMTRPLVGPDQDAFKRKRDE